MQINKTTSIVSHSNQDGIEIFIFMRDGKAVVVTYFIFNGVVKVDSSNGTRITRTHYHTGREPKWILDIV